VPTTVTRVDLSDRFRKDFKRLDPQAQSRAEAVIRDLWHHPLRGTLRHHTLNGYTPIIHVVDLTANHAHQITFHFEGTVITLLRVADHKSINRSPA
jgi:mRNA-degrading endonuclease YafQ of YafQ-DinJ toxin-antitoxin module